MNGQINVFTTSWGSFFCDGNRLYVCIEIYLIVSKRQ